MSTSRELPDFIPVMLAKAGEPFDSDDFIFEIKWDGTRTLAFVDRQGYHLVNRRKVDMTCRYPEFDFLSSLPPGTVLDGEVVVLDQGKPSFRKLLSRENTASQLKIRSLASSMPAVYIVFDQLYRKYDSIMDQPIEARRSELQRTVRDVDQERLVVSQESRGGGRAFFDETVKQELEGVMAKRLGSRYLPGKRSDAWIKIKRRSSLPCAIIGFLPAEDGSRDFKSLILATHDEGLLRTVGKVGTGFTRPVREQVNQLIWSRIAETPLLPSAERGKWLEPGLYCEVSFLERTAGGDLRNPVFERLIAE